MQENNNMDPRIFKVTIVSDGLRFNHKIQVDTIFLNGEGSLAYDS